MANPRGVFITFEGLDGCGKSTQMQKLATALRRAGHDVVTTREPGGTELGERIRGLLMSAKTRNLAPKAELLLMWAARAQHLHEVILPTQRAGKIVLSDRFADSTEAYQGGGRRLGAELTANLHRLLGDKRPDLTILMDCDLEATLARARRRNRKKKDGAGNDDGRFESEDSVFFERVHAAYLAIARREPERVVVVNARRPVGVVHREILGMVKARLGNAAPRRAGASQ